MKNHANDSPQTDTVLSDTRIWLERAVIGLNLCPFAKGVQVKGQIHYSVSAATSPQDLLDDLKGELSGELTVQRRLEERMPFALRKQALIRGAPRL